MSFFVIAKTLVKSFFRRPYTVRYPFGPRVYHGGITRGIVCNDIKQCIFCGLCQKKCPTKALTVIREEKKWIRDPLRCISCGYCVENCPKKCLSMKREYNAPTVNKEKEIYQGA